MRAQWGAMQGRGMMYSIKGRRVVQITRGMGSAGLPRLRKQAWPLALQLPLSYALSLLYCVCVCLYSRRARCCQAVWRFVTGWNTWAFKAVWACTAHQAHSGRSAFAGVFRGDVQPVQPARVCVSSHPEPPQACTPACPWLCRPPCLLTWAAASLAVALGIQNTAHSRHCLLDDTYLGSRLSCSCTSCH